MTASPTERTATGWVPEVDTFAKRLVLTRLKMGWHNADAASREYGLPKESYRGWEKGTNLPRDLISVCWAISKRTGVDFGWLYGGEAMAGEQPSEETLKWLRPPTGTTSRRGNNPNVDYGPRPKRSISPLGGDGCHSSERTTIPSRPSSGRPFGRPRTGSTGPGSTRPERVPRPHGR